MGDLKRVLILGFCAAALGACSKSTPDSCNDGASCPEGHACIGGACELLCSNDGDCLAGESCRNGTYCQAGVRGGPVILSVEGRSNNVCQPQGAALASRCIGPGFTVTGDNLAGSSFALVGVTPGSPRFELTADGRAESSVIDLTLASGEPAVSEGIYTLVATNAAGSDQTGQLQLLQGDPGPPGADGADGNGAGSSLIVYRYNNATVPTQTQTDSARMHVTLTASTTSTTSIGIDDTRLATAGAKGRVGVWETDLARLKQSARAIAGRELSEEELKLFRVGR